MDKILEELRINLSEHERKALLEYIPDTTIDALNILREIGSEDATKISRIINQSNKTSARDYNNSFEHIFLDLFSLFLKSTIVNNVIESSKNKSMSVLKEIDSIIKDIEKKLNRYKFIVNNKEGFTRSYQDIFQNYDMMEEFQGNKLLYTNPDTGNIPHINSIANISNNFGLTLNTLMDVQPDFMTARKSSQSGANLIYQPDKKTDINTIFSSEKDKVWSENILVDSPFDLSFEEASYFERSFGALCKLSITLSDNMPLNYIQIEPYSEQPFEIVSIISYDSLENHKIAISSDRPIEDIDGVTILLSPNSETKPFNIEDNTLISFPNVNESKVIDIAIRQENYKISRFINEESEIQHINIMNDIFAGSPITKNILTNEDLNSTIGLDYYNRNRTWSNYSSIFTDILNNQYIREEKDIVSGLIDSISYLVPGVTSQQLRKLTNDFKEETYDQKNNKSVQKYHYQYGIKTLKAGYRNYANQSIYVSKPFSVDTSVKEVALNVEDKIVEKNNYPFGYIKYYVTNRQDPSDNDWYPILPEGKSKSIKAEPVFVDDSGVGKTKFPFTTGSLEIYQSYDKQNQLTPTTTNNSQEFSLGESHYQTVYCYYQVDENFNPHIVNFDDVSRPIEYVSNNTTGETFDKTNNKNSVTLSHFPYIDYDAIEQSTLFPKDIIDNTHYPVDDQYVLYNRNLYKYNPNYKPGYMPISIEMEGEYPQHNINTGRIEYEIGKIPNDEIGLGYQTIYYDSIENKNIILTRNQEEQVLTPYFYNKTNYLKRDVVNLTKYDLVNNPVFEYAQLGNKIFFNTDLDNEVNVKYKYLVDGIRIKIVMYKFTEENITPVLKNYLIKSRDFQYQPGGF